VYDLTNFLFLIPLLKISTYFLLKIFANIKNFLLNKD